RNSPRARKPEVRATIATALKKRPNVPRMTSNGAVDAETCPYWWFAATRGSQHNQEMTKALIVKRIAARIGARRGRITAGVTVRFDPACFPAPSVSRRLGAMGKIDRAVAAEFRILFTGYVGERVASTV